MPRQTNANKANTTAAGKESKVAISDIVTMGRGIDDDSGR